MKNKIIASTLVLLATLPVQALEFPNLDEDKTMFKIYQNIKETKIADKNWKAGTPVDIFSGKNLQNNQVIQSMKKLQKQQQFQVMNGIDIVPLVEHSASGKAGDVTIYYNSSNQTQIRGTYNGSKFNTAGDSQVQFTGRTVGMQNNSKYVQYFSPTATIIVANNYPLSGISDEVKKELEEMSPGCTDGGSIKTAVAIAKPSGVEVVAGINAVVHIQ